VSRAGAVLARSGEKPSLNIEISQSIVLAPYVIEMQRQRIIHLAAVMLNGS
jgi:hypothetical protein